MATYENGYEEKEESAQMTEDDLSYKDKYDDHQSICSWTKGMVSGNHTGGKLTRTSHAIPLTT